MNQQNNDEYKGEIQQGNVKKEEMVQTAPLTFEKYSVTTGPQTQSQNTNKSQGIEVQLKFQQQNTSDDNDDNIKEWIKKNSVREFDANKPLKSLIENLFADISVDLSKKAEITQITFDGESSDILLVNEENLNQITKYIKDFKQDVKIVKMMILLKD